MTPEEFEMKMREIRRTLHDEYDDEECCHSAMDDVMCELLVMLGYKAGVDIFLDTPKWYA